MLSKPLVVGVVTNNREEENGYPLAAIGRFEIDAIKSISDATPVLLPAYNDVMTSNEAFGLCDGFLFTGGRANVHPSHYGHATTEAHEPFNQDRDALTLPLARMAVNAGKPILAICRGCQELAVAFGSTLHPDIESLDGVGMHRMPQLDTAEERIGYRHNLTLRQGGSLEKLLGSNVVRVNSLHRQAIDQVGVRVKIEAWAEDGVIEAISICDTPSFAIGVQWHPEYKYSTDPVSIKLFKAFGEALRRARCLESKDTCEN